MGFLGYSWLLSRRATLCICCTMRFSHCLHVSKGLPWVVLHLQCHEPKVEERTLGMKLDIVAHSRLARMASYPFPLLCYLYPPLSFPSLPSVHPNAQLHWSSPHTCVQRYGKWKEGAFEQILYSLDTAEEIVVQLIVVCNAWLDALTALCQVLLHSKRDREREGKSERESERGCFPCSVPCMRCDTLCGTLEEKPPCISSVNPFGA